MSSGAKIALLLLLAVPTLAQEIPLAQKRSDPFIVVKDGRYGFIDQSGKIVIPALFYWASAFYKGMATVYICDRFGSIDPLGHLHPLRHAAPGDLEPTKSGDKFGFVDETGKFRIPAIFDEAYAFGEDLAAVKVGNKWGFVDKSGRQVIPPTFDEAYFFSSGVGNARIDGQDVIIDREGKVIHRGESFYSAVQNQRVPIQLDVDKAGFLDISGKVAIPFVYQSVGPFSEGLATAEQKQKWGYVDPSGLVEIPFKLDQAGEFALGLAPAKRGSESGFITKKGEFAFHLNYDWTAGFEFGDLAAFTTTDNDFGYVNTSGRVVWGPRRNSAPDHWPLLGMSEASKKASCENIPDDLRRQAQQLPARTEE